MIIILTLLLCPIAIAVLGSFTFWSVTDPLHFYKPIVLLIGSFIVMLLLWIVLLIIFGEAGHPKKNHDTPSKWSRFWLRQSLQFVDYFAQVRTKVTGKDLIPEKERFLLVCNHRSNFDPMISFEKLGKYDLAYITKPSNFKIPLGKRFMRGMGFMGIDRNDPLQSLEVVKLCIDKIQTNKASIGVYPEGTRHLDCKLGEFHEGMFNIALKAECPIVVSTITGTENIKNNYPFKRTRVKLDIIKLIPFEDIQYKTAKEVSDEVRSMIDNHISEVEKAHNE